MDVENNIEDNYICRKSKRQKAFPFNLLADYHCGQEIVGLVCQPLKYLSVTTDGHGTVRKYEELEGKLESSM